jgi:hypothetical protein
MSKDVETVAVVYNPWPEEKLTECAGSYWYFPPGEREVPQSVADFVAGPAGSPGGALGGAGLRQLSPALTSEEKAAVKRDGIRAAVLHARKFGRGRVTDEMEAIADGVIDGSISATVEGKPAVSKAPPAPAHLPNPEPGETFDPAKHRPQNRSDSHAGEAGAHAKIVGIASGVNLGAHVSDDVTPPPPAPEPPPPPVAAAAPESPKKGKTKKGG